MIINIKIEKGTSMKDNIQTFYTKLREVDDLCYLENYLKYQLAPVIKGFKPSSTLNMTSYRAFNVNWDRWRVGVLGKLGLECITLRETKNSKVLLFYRKDLIREILQEQATKEFLQQLDYPVEGPDEAIAHLARRYEEYHCPHELGVFLGIPLSDVKEFMTCTQKKCLMCGYWKVYSNLNQAVQTFEQYDRAKDEMLQNLLGQLGEESWVG